MNIKQELREFKCDIDHEIDVYLDRVIREIEEIDPFVLGAVKYFKKTILAGGKRIRPIMMCWGYRAAGGKDYKEILKSSISIEFIHAFLLMHDDIIDRDDIRHGKKTMHAKYRDYNKRFLFDKDADHFGSSIAIVLGDFVYSLGNQVLFKSKFDPNLIIKALNKLQSIVGLTVVGEMQDVYMEYSEKVTEEDILQMYENKTAKYTFEGPLQLGAMLAGANNAFCKQIGAYAVPIGIAFQIRDDILGVFGDMKKTGKSVGSDIAEGKMTLIVNRAYKNATSDQKKELDRLLGNQDIDANSVRKFQTILVDTGAQKSVENYMGDLILQAQRALKNMSLENDADRFLFSLTEYLNNREN